MNGIVLPPGPTLLARLEQIRERQEHLELGLRLLQGPIDVDVSEIEPGLRDASLRDFARRCELGQQAVAHVRDDLDFLIRHARGF